MSAIDDLDGTVLVAAIAPSCAALALGASPWLALGLLAAVGWGVAVAAGYLHLAAQRGPPAS
jgi:hypothetical protein